MIASTGPPRSPRTGPLQWLRAGTPMERGTLAVLTALLGLTAGAWVLTVHQARTMDMPMGVVAGGAASGEIARQADDAVPAADEGGQGMAESPGPAEGMGGMAMPGADVEAPAEQDRTTGGDTAFDGMGGATMAGMTAEAWSLGGFAAFLAAWAVMMVAMMFPAAAPMLLLFRAVHAKRRAAGGAFVPTWVFAAGYVLVWTAVGAATWVLVQLSSEAAGRLGSAGRETWAPLALGATLAVAGAYQLTPLKRVCLRHCQSPLGFVMAHWREGRLGALRMGLGHGVYCLGCCWALFAVLVVAGVMSLAWMLVLTLVVFAEKVIPHGQRTATAVGLALVLLGGLVAAGATGMPWAA